MSPRRLTCKDYTVGWISPLSLEITAARALLDEEEDDKPYDLKPDSNSYVLGSICGHNIVIAGLGNAGTNSAAAVVARMLNSFKSIRFGLLVGIGGGVPSEKHDIRLGDVVVSNPGDQYGGVVEYDHKKTLPEGKFVPKGLLNRPHDEVLTAVTNLRSKHEIGSNPLKLHLETITAKVNSELQQQYKYPGKCRDKLLKVQCTHDGNHTACVGERQVAIHYGTIASGNQLMRDEIARDQIRKDYKDCDILCFEMEGAGLMNQFSCLVIRGISDYADNDKNDDWQRYASATAAAYAKDLLGIIQPAQVATLRVMEYPVGPIVFTEDEIKCLQCLYKSDYAFHRRRNPVRLPGTCEWFLQHKKYLYWREEPKSSLLWVSADPGCGKSVLASFLVDELASTQSQSTFPGTICYFFFKDDNDEQKSATIALCALLHQLFIAEPSLIKHAMVEYTTKTEKFVEELGTLWRILTASAADTAGGNVHCVIDGLDECEELSRTLLVDYLVRFYTRTQQCNSGAFLNVLVTSRPYPSIERSFHTLPTIRLKAEDEIAAIGNDIALVIDARIRSIGLMRGLSKDVQAALKRKLTDSADRTFLWVSLILRLIEDSPRANRRALDDVINTIPDSLDAVYNKILERSTNKADARKLLHIIVAATRPLSLDEMNVAFAIKPGDRSYEDLDLEPDISSTIRDLCGLFVRVIDKKIYLVHQTAKEFLTQPANSVCCEHIWWKHSLSGVESNLILAEICIRYLLFSIFESYAPPMLSNIFADDFDIRDSIELYASKYNFFQYAATYWADHFRGAREEPRLLELALAICNTRSMRFMAWLHMYWATAYYHEDCPVFLTSLIAVSYFGLETLTQKLLERGANVAAKGQRGRRALHEAAKMGHEAVVRTLLNYKVDVNAKDDDGRTALHWAALRGHEAVLWLLLEKGADVECVDVYGSTAMDVEAKCGQGIVVRLLLKSSTSLNYKMNINAKGVYGQTLLHRVADRGQYRVVRQLLKMGVDTEIEDEYGETALSRAARNGRYVVVQLLVENGANVGATDAIGWTPLSWAAAGGQENVVRLLLKNGANPDSQDNSGRTPLWWAVNRGHEAIVRLLRYCIRSLSTPEHPGPSAFPLEFGEQTPIDLAWNPFYVYVGVNGTNFKAAVMCGFQGCMMSPSCAKLCGIWRIMDKKLAGRALGTGGATRIFGRVHAVSVNVGSNFFSTSFSILQPDSPLEVALGLDFFKRNGARIDFGGMKCVLLGEDVPFL